MDYWGLSLVFNSSHPLGVPNELVSSLPRLLCVCVGVTVPYLRTRTSAWILGVSPWYLIPHIHWGFPNELVSSLPSLLCVCVCVTVHRSVWCVVCLNHEVVVFQSQTGTDPDLGSVASYNFYSSPPTPPVSFVFLDISISLFHFTSPPLVTVRFRITSLFCTRSPPPLPAQNDVHLDVVHTCHPPPSLA